MWPNPQFPDKKTDVSKVLLMKEEGIQKKKLSYVVSKKRKKKEATAFLMVVTDLEYVVRISST